MDKQITPQDSRYVPLTAQKYLCVPACIQIVMHKLGLPLIPAETLGYHLGLIVPEEDRSLFYNPRTGEMPKAGWGTQINLPEYEPNKVFEELGIPLHVDFTLADSLDSEEQMKILLKGWEQKGLLVCFDAGTLYDTDRHFGHVCVIDKVDFDTKTIRLIDPDYKEPKWREVSFSKLYEAIKKHGSENFGGLWELRKTN